MIPAIFEIDENGEATGVVHSYCSENCRFIDEVLQYSNKKRFHLGENDPIGLCDGDRCEKCGVVLVNSLPEKPFKFKWSKDLVGKAIRVGWSDSPADEGIITHVDFANKKVGLIQFLDINDIHHYKEHVTETQVESRKQVISIGEVKLVFPEDQPKDKTIKSLEACKGKVVEAIINNGWEVEICFKDGTHLYVEADYHPTTNNLQEKLVTKTDDPHNEDCVVPVV